MFKKIRRNFILIAMGCASLILLFSIGIINIVNYRNVNISCDNIISLIYKEKPKDSSEYLSYSEPPKPGEIGDNSYFVASEINGELKIDEQQFHVRVLSLDEALNIANKVKDSGKKIGYYNYYRYNVIENKYIFLDATSRVDSANKFLLISIFASLGGLVAFFLLIFFTSKVVLKPVLESYMKQKKFITNASHELKTPLTIISANNELLEMNGVLNEYTTNIDMQVKSMTKKIKDLIDYSKISETTNRSIEDIDLSEVVNMIGDSYKNVFDKANISLKMDVKSNITYKGCMDDINHIMTLIFDNAIKYALTNVNVSLYKVKNQIIFIQSNDANNIKDGDLSYYKERFYRSDDVRNSKDGSGIGLSMLDELTTLNKIKTNIYGKDGLFHIELIFKNK